MQTVPAFAASAASSLPRLLELPNAGELMAELDADAAKAQRENFLMEQGNVELPEPFDDHAKHIAEHNRFRKSAAYQQAEPGAREVMDAHVKAHETLAAEEAVNQQQLDMQHPGASTLPQENEPMGSNVPPDHAERVGAMNLQPKGSAPASPGPGPG
jgi:hypothetical protein